MEIEASVPPPAIRFQKLCKNYAFRLLKLDNLHSIRQRVSNFFPLHENGINLYWNRFLDWNEFSEPREQTQGRVRTHSSSGNPLLQGRAGTPPNPGEPLPQGCVRARPQRLRRRKKEMPS
jgi:hypothetical protein